MKFTFSQFIKWFRATASFRDLLTSWQSFGAAFIYFLAFKNFLLICYFIDTFTFPSNTFICCKQRDQSNKSILLPETETSCYNTFLFTFIKKNLQYCVGFCHTTTCISYTYTYIPSLLSLPSLPHNHPIPLSHHSAPDWVPCVIRQLLTS